MATLNVHRILLIVPVAKVSAVVAWFQTNVGPNAVPADLGPPLNVSGLDTDSASHRWCCGSYTDAEAKAILAQFCQRASVTPAKDSDWIAWTGDQKRAWAAGVKDGLKAADGVLVSLADNVGQWDDPAQALKAMGVKTVQAAVKATDAEPVKLG